jgi:hypothetical protein
MFVRYDRVDRSTRFVAGLGHILCDCGTHLDLNTFRRCRHVQAYPLALAVPMARRPRMKQSFETSRSRPVVGCPKGFAAFSLDRVSTRHVGFRRSLCRFGL